MKAHQLRLLRSLAYGSPSQICTTCARSARQFSSIRPLLQAAPQPQQENPKAPSPPPPPSSPLDFEAAKPRAPPPSQQIHRQGSKPPTTPGGHWKHPGYIEPLGRPIGSGQPPTFHDNSPVDTRDLTERYKDFTNVEKHLEKREKIKSALARPYFRDWKNLEFEKGKLWLGNEKLWRADVSLWMPNLVGDTLVGELWRSTTETLRGKVSLVAVYQRDWAKGQAESWYGAKENPKVAKMIEDGKLNLLQVNVEDAPLARSIQGIFRWYMRRGMDKKKQENYFFVKQIPDSVVEEIGILNSRVGYVYLVDQDCKIRWAGCADANEGEKEALVKGCESLVRRLEMGATARP